MTGFFDDAAIEPDRLMLNLCSLVYAGLPQYAVPTDRMVTTESYRKFFLTTAYFFAMILNNNKGYDGEGSAQVLFQRAGGWCEPVTDAQNL